MKLGFGLFAYAALGIVGLVLVIGLVFLPDQRAASGTDEPPGLQAPLDPST